MFTSTRALVLFQLAGLRKVSKSQGASTCQGLSGCYYLPKSTISPSFLTPAKPEGTPGASQALLTPVRESRKEMVLLSPSSLWAWACLGTMPTSAAAVSERASGSVESGPALAFLSCEISFFCMAYCDFGLWC